MHMASNQKQHNQSEAVQPMSSSTNWLLRVVAMFKPSQPARLAVMHQLFDSLRSILSSINGFMHKWPCVTMSKGAVQHASICRSTVVHHRYHTTPCNSCSCQLLYTATILAKPCQHEWLYTATVTQQKVHSQDAHATLFTADMR